jgi:hypothetical protein
MGTLKVIMEGYQGVFYGFLAPQGIPFAGIALMVLGFVFVAGIWLSAF